MAEVLSPSPGPLPEGERFVDGVPVSKTLRPESVGQLAELIKDEKGTIVPVGGRTGLDFGNPLQRADCVVDLSRLNRITEYNPADLTVHVEAGVTLGALQRALLEKNQFLPLDPWSGPQTTIGGIAAMNAQGPFRAAGTIRDWIIGMKVVGVTGEISKCGGRVVKNVTGYDLHKLYTGSLGTLAVIAEVSLKLRAKFATTATAVARTASTAEAARLVSSIRKSALQPVCCEWTGPDNQVWIRFAEHPSAVDWQLANLPAAEWRILRQEEEEAAWESLRLRYNALQPIIVRIVGLPSAVDEVIAEYRPGAWVAHALNGIILAQVASVTDVRRIREKYRVVIEKAPLETRRQVATFGLNGTEFTLMKKMKDAFDSQGRLNPGRHVDGEHRD